jgi:tRNA threonylcarbamoyladenosine biosynthesis protein TsaE
MRCALKDLKTLSYKISKKVKIGHTIYLKGNLGTGKTTLSKLIISEIFKKNKKKSPQVTSPTFNIVQYYPVKNKLIIAHYDLYRLKSELDLENIGLFELEDKVINIIEWPELIKKKNINRIEINLKHTKLKNERDIKIKYFGKTK